jgi:Fe-S cluster assembly iron-binding protein IscA
MTLDELKENDLVYEFGNFKYIVDKEFMEQAKPIKVDFTPMGFKVTSSIDLGAGCGSSCGSEGACG